MNPFRWPALNANEAQDLRHLIRQPIRPRAGGIAMSALERELAFDPSRSMADIEAEHEVCSEA